ncbi:MAG TPA: HAD-IIA family hydrolase [Clostridiales bacterium]|nr:HAD-IIA family hydrolase [Clostridiales bacterium]
MLKRLKNAELFLLDMDGTIYLGNQAIDGAAQAINKLKSLDKKICYLTNNSSKSARQYLDKLRGLGFDAKIDEIVTSGIVAADYISRFFKGQSVYLFGTDELKREFKSYGIKLTQDNPDIVVIGFHTKLTYDELDLACGYIRQGKLFFATHPDKNCPTDNGFMPDVGSFLSLIYTSANRKPSKIFGKPYKYMVNYLKSKFLTKAQNIAMVGDRLSTDIKFANKFGMISVLALSGETDQRMLQDSKIKPDLVFESIKDLADIF